VREGVIGLRKLPRASRRHWANLAEHGNGPMIAGWSGSSRVLIAHLVPHPGSTMLGTGAELPPVLGDVRRSSV
jgi:hypothetical protein